MSTDFEWIYERANRVRRGGLLGVTYEEAKALAADNPYGGPVRNDRVKIIGIDAIVIDMPPRRSTMSDAPW